MPMPAASDPEIKICGAHACSAVAQRRPEDVRRVYITEAMMPSFGEFLRWCASQRLAYHVVEENELERITQSVHHGGVAFIVRQPPPPTLGSLLHRLRGEDPSTPRLLIYLDNVQNPHNLGAIVRVAAHFGADGVLLAGEATSTSTAMTRTAEGGAEFIDVVPVALGQRPLLAARSAGFTLVATTSHGRDSLYGDGLPPRTVIMLGSESHGLAPSVFGLADMTLTIPGSGQVESLNVACAAAVLLAEHWRAHHATPNREPQPSAPSADPKRPKSAKTSDNSEARPSPKGTPRSRGKGGKRTPGGHKSSDSTSGKHGKPGKSGKSGKASAGKPGKASAGKPGKASAGKPGKASAGKPRKPSGKASGKHGGPGQTSGQTSSQASRTRSGAAPGGKSSHSRKPRP